MEQPDQGMLDSLSSPCSLFGLELATYTSGITGR